jgi:hypothetical protein
MKVVICSGISLISISLLCVMGCNSSSAPSDYRAAGPQWVSHEDAEFMLIAIETHGVGVLFAVDYSGVYPDNWNDSSVREDVLLGAAGGLSGPIVWHEVCRSLSVGTGMKRKIICVRLEIGPGGAATFNGKEVNGRGDRLVVARLLDACGAWEQLHQSQIMEWDWDTLEAVFVKSYFSNE